MGEIIEKEYDQFVEDWGPVLSENDEVDYWEDLNKVLKKFGNEGLKRVWTIVEYDGTMYVAPGSRIVNRTGLYIVTTKPHDFSNEAYKVDYIWHKDEDNDSG